MSETKEIRTQERAASPATAASEEKKAALVPPVDIYENENGIVLLADMPGVSKDGLDIQVDKDVLTIKGAIAQQIPEDAKPLYVEFSGPGRYERAFTIGPDVDIDKIEASMKAGVVRLFLPKAEHSKPHKIEVKVA